MRVVNKQVASTVDVDVDEMDQSSIDHTLHYLIRPSIAHTVKDHVAGKEEAKR